MPLRQTAVHVGESTEVRHVSSLLLHLFDAVVGFFARKLDFSFVTFLIGFVIGPNLELSFRQSLQLLDHNALNLLQHPIALVFLVLTVVVAWWIGHGSRLAASSTATSSSAKNPAQKSPSSRQLSS